MRRCQRDKQTAEVLSVVIPTLNEVRSLGPLLGSLQAVRARGAELVVADGGSSDGTPELAKPKVDRLVSVPRGRAVQMNAGASWARGDMLWFLHADCLPMRNSDLAIGRALADGSDWGRFDVRLSGGAHLLRIIERAMNLRSRLSGIMTGDQGMFVRRALFRAVGGFPEVPLMEDVAMSKLLRRRSAPACLGNRVLVSSRKWEQEGISSTIWLMWRLRMAYFLGADPQRLRAVYYANANMVT